jgi:hypothetical protein
MRLFTLIIILLPLTVFCQDYKIVIENYSKSDLEKAASTLSVDKISPDKITAFANEREFLAFKELKIPFSYKKICRTKTSKKINDALRTSNDLEEIKNFSIYPSYHSYLDFLEFYNAEYHDITEIEEIGESVEKRKLLALKIFDGENEKLCPKVFLTSSMHGDEVCGLVLMLRLIDFLLTEKDTNEKVKKILSSIVLYINPLANPDGTYSDCNGDLSRAKRYNANNEDLNRDFQTIFNFEKTSFQPETEAMQKFAEKHHFTMSANFHAGDEVVNFPWDSFYEKEFELPDKEWFIDISKQYVDSARVLDKDYLKSICQEGYVFGADWYKVSGGRQDYMMYFQRCREFTIELSNVKLLDREKLEEFWQKNKTPLLNFILSSLDGFSGQVTNENGFPLKAQIVIPYYDKNNSSVFCDENGFFFRPFLKNKKIEVCAFMDGYKTECQEITTPEKVNFILKPGHNDIVSVEKNPSENTEIRFFCDGGFLTVESRKILKNVKIISSDGKVIFENCPENFTAKFPLHNYKSGFYVVKAQTDNFTVKTHKIVITK